MRGSSATASIHVSGPTGCRSVRGSPAGRRSVHRSALKLGIVCYCEVVVTWPGPIYSILAILILCRHRSACGRPTGRGSRALRPVIGCDMRPTVRWPACGSPAAASIHVGSPAGRRSRVLRPVIGCDMRTAGRRSVRGGPATTIIHVGGPASGWLSVRKCSATDWSDRG